MTNKKTLTDCIVGDDKKVVPVTNVRDFIRRIKMGAMKFMVDPQAMINLIENEAGSELI